VLFHQDRLPRLSFALISWIEFQDESWITAISRLIDEPPKKVMLPRETEAERGDGTQRKKK
jgi:hypothetical protein